MEPPADAVLRNGVWHSRPLIEHLPDMQIRAGNTIVLTAAPCANPTH